MEKTIFLCLGIHFSFIQGRLRGERLEEDTPSLPSKKVEHFNKKLILNQNHQKSFSKFLNTMKIIL